MEDDEHRKLQIDGGYVTGLYLITPAEVDTRAYGMCGDPTRRTTGRFRGQGLRGGKIRAGASKR